MMTASISTQATRPPCPRWPQPVLAAEHGLQLVVRDKAGNTIISSNLVTIYVQRASVLNRSGR